MKTSILCPYRFHRMRKRLGLIVKAQVRYEMKWDGLWNLNGSMQWLNCSWYTSRGHDYPWWILLQKRKALLGFWCRHCNKALPEEMNKECLEHLRNQTILSKLKE